MKKILYTLRVDVVNAYAERRDSADQRIPQFLEKCGAMPVPVPNTLSCLKEYLYAMHPAGFFLTGGNDLMKYHGNAMERDKTENTILDYAAVEHVPVYGICRGMQVIIDYYGMRLVEVDHHVRVMHAVKGLFNVEHVNSFHQYGIRDVKKPFIVAARSLDDTVEAVIHENGQIIGTMWHPERMDEFQEHDLMRVRNLFRL